MFEPETTLDDLNQPPLHGASHREPLQFLSCRGLRRNRRGIQARRRGTSVGRLLWVRLPIEARGKAFHQIANFAFFNRNFSDYGLHYFNMQVDFYFQLLRRFHPEALTQSLRAAVRNFIKLTNLDTYEGLCRIYDFVAACDPADAVAIRGFARDLRVRVDRQSRALLFRGERILNCLEDAYARKGSPVPGFAPAAANLFPLDVAEEQISLSVVPGLEFTRPGSGWEAVDLFGVARAPVPYPSLPRTFGGRRPDLRRTCLRLAGKQSRFRPQNGRG